MKDFFILQGRNSTIAQDNKGFTLTAMGQPVSNFSMWNDLRGLDVFLIL